MREATSTARRTRNDVDRLNKIAEGLISGEDPARLREVARRAHELAVELSYPTGQAYSLIFLGFSHWFESAHDEAIARLTEARRLFEESGDRAGAHKALLPLLSVQKERGTYDQSLENNLECLKFFRETGTPFWESLALLALSSLYFEVGDIDKAIQVAREVVAIGENLEQGWVKARGLVHLGSAYQAREDYAQARLYYQRALVAFRHEANLMGEARSLNDLAVIDERLGRFDEALRGHLDALRIREVIGQRQAQCTSLVNLGRLFLLKGEPERALEQLERSLDIAHELESRPKLYQTHQVLSDAYEELGDTAKALRHHREFQRIKEEVFNNDANAHLQNLQTRFEVERTEREAEIERLKNVELESKNEQLEQLLTELKAAQVQLLHAEKMAALGKLVAGIVHELNTPIGAIKTASDLIVKRIAKLRRQSPDNGLDELASDAKLVEAASERVSSLVRSLKSFVRLDQADYQHADLRDGIQSTLDLIEGALTPRINVVKEFDEIGKIWCCPAEMNQVFLALLTNAAEAIEDRGTLRIVVEDADESVSVRITDDGKGIPTERLDRLFEFDFSAAGSRIKMSSGLVTAHNIVSKHGGRIAVESEPGRGSTFSIVLPKVAPVVAGREAN